MPTKYVRAAGGNWNDAATWALTSGGTETTTVPTAADDVVVDSGSGNMVVNAANAFCKSFIIASDYAGVITHTGFSIVVSGNITLQANKYVQSVGSVALYIAGTGTLTTNGCTLGTVSINSTGAVLLGDNLTFSDVKNCTLRFFTNVLNLNGKTISGNSATNRLLIYSDTIGTPRTVTVNGGSFANCDFQDIAFANGGADLDLSAGSIGNCGGNSMSGGGTLTFPPVRTCTFDSTGGNWGDAAKWTDDLGGHNVPLVHHLARFQPMSAGQTITVDMPRLPDTDFSGCGASNLPNVAATTTGLTYSCYGSLNLTGIAAGGWSCNKDFTFIIRTNASLTSNGQTFNSLPTRVYAPNAVMTFNDAFTSSSLVQYLGTLQSVYNITINNFQGASGAVFTYSATITCTASGASWNSNGGTINSTGIIALAYTGANAASFLGGTNTYNDITIAPGSGVLTFSGAFTFHDMTMSSAGTRSIVFTKGTTYTMTGTNFLSGTAGNLITIASSGAGEPFTLSKANGLIASNFLAIKDSIATGGATWLAGYESTNISGNTGWHFNSPAIPSPAIITVGASTATAKALCRGVPAAASIIVNASVATAKALCRGIPTAAVINVLATCSFIIATWSDNLFKASERYIGQYFKASKRRN